VNDAADAENAAGLLREKLAHIPLHPGIGLKQQLTTFPVHQEKQS